MDVQNSPNTVVLGFVKADIFLNALIITHLQNEFNTQLYESDNNPYI